MTFSQPNKCRAEAISDVADCPDHPILWPSRIHQAHEAADQGLVEGTEFLPICLSCKSLTIQAMARFEKNQTLQEVLLIYKRVNVASLSAACRLAKT